jgi:hypothetical protein
MKPSRLILLAYNLSSVALLGLIGFSSLSMLSG